MAYEDARKYLSRVLPWDNKHYISAHHVFEIPGKQKKDWPLPGKPFLKIDDTLNNLDYWCRRKVDTYVCLASQVGVHTRSKDGKSFTVADRTIENVAFRKCLCMDFDVKEDTYATTDDAKRALIDFVQWGGLPQPTVIVASGTGGFHTYWSFQEPISLPTWRPLAHALVRMALEYGIKFDTGCTTDPVRVLRVPGTFNYKPGGPYPVGLLHASAADLPISILEHALSGFAEPLTGSGPILVTSESNGAPDDDDTLGAGITKRIVPPSDIDRVSLVCPHLRSTLDSAGAECGQPLWFLDLRLATCCEAGRDAAHRLSSGHAGYSAQETDEVYDRLVAEKEAKPSIGPPRCQTMMLAGAKECVTCPNLKLGFSPLNIPGAYAPLQNVVPIAAGASSLPDGYHRGGDGFVYVLKFDEKTNSEMRVSVFPYQIIDPWVESGREYAINFTTIEEIDTPKHVRIPFKELADANASGRALAGEGLPMRVKPETQDFIMAFLKTLRDKAGSIVRCEPVGWHHHNGELYGFAYNGILYSPTGETQAQHMQPELRANYTPVGDPSFWSSAVHIINAQKRPPLDMLILSAFASPLIQFAHQSGVSVGGWSFASGVGKTTALQIAQAVWGHPIRASGGLNDTANATFARAGLTRNLPLIWDEIKTQKQTATFVETIFTMTGGREKARLNRAAKAAHQGEWQTILTYASNSSMFDAVVADTRTTSAGHVRIFEFKVPAVENAEMVSTMASLVDKLRTNFGHAGLVYAKWLGENFAHAAKVVGHLYTDLEVKWNISQDERYWNAIMAATLAGALFANHLGLTAVDVPGLKLWMRIEFDRMRDVKNTAPNDFSRAINITNALGQFLAEKRPQNTLRTDNIPAGRGKPPPNSIKIIDDGQQTDRLGEIQVQIAIGPRIIRIADHALTHWCKRECIPKSAMVEGMQANLGARHCLVRLGSGTRLSTTTIAAWEMLVSGTPLDTALDW